MGERNFSRVDFTIAAKVVAGDRSLTGTVENLSLNGVFVKTDEKLPVDEQVHIDVTLSGISPDLVLSLSGVVVRVTEEGMALKFQKVDLDTFTHLKNIISYKSGNADKVMDELMDYIDRKLAAKKKE